MKNPFKILISLILVLFIGYLFIPSGPSNQSPILGKIATTTPLVPHCDASLWQHVYSGDPRRFSHPQDRLQIIQDCISVSGTIETAIAEADGDFHIRLKLDSQYASLLNAKNISSQRGDLVLEPVCENAVTQKDTIKEGACNGFHQDIFQKSMIGKHVEVVGAYVTDMEHGWNEIHPVTLITVK